MCASRIIVADSAVCSATVWRPVSPALVMASLTVTPRSCWRIWPTKVDSVVTVEVVVVVVATSAPTSDRRVLLTVDVVLEIDVVGVAALGRLENRDDSTVSHRLN